MASSARIDELRKKFEENPRRYFAPLANEYRKAGDINQAIAICREYLPQQPGHMSGHIVYGQALYEARQFDEAKTVFETALSLDPENLIALRHLGDIALIVGDSEAARTWYGRVLEADPRNEEIQAQLASLAQASSAAPTPIASAAVPGAALHTPPAPATPPTPATSSPVTASAPTVVMSAVPRPDQSAAKEPEPVSSATVTADSPTAEVRLDTIPTHAPPPAQSDAPVEMALGLEPTSFAPPAEPVAPAPMLEIDSPVTASKDAAPLDSFSLAGLETTSLASEPAASPEPVAPPATPPPAPAPRTSAVLAELDLGAVELPAPEPSSPPAPTALPDLDFGEPAAGAPPAEELPLLDIGELPAAPVSEAAPPPAEAPVEAVEVAEVSDEPQAAPDSGPFVTETMAELYLQQGHHEEALRVYRALLEQRPGDATLQAKVASLTPSAPVSAVPRSGLTMREILSVIAQRRPGSRPEPSRENGATPEAAQPSLGHDGLATLFGALEIGQVDEAAARSLALAFMDLNGLEGGPGRPEALPVSGAPARHASNDLSLDTVFGGGEVPASAAPASFSFDQFFSQRATGEHPTGSGTPGVVNAESGDDVAKFTQWLEGLKQR